MELIVSVLAFLLSYLGSRLAKIDAQNGTVLYGVPLMVLSALGWLMLEFRGPSSPSLNFFAGTDGAILLALGLPTMLGYVAQRVRLWVQSRE